MIIKTIFVLGNGTGREFATAYLIEYWRSGKLFRLDTQIIYLFNLQVSVSGFAIKTEMAPNLLKPIQTL